MIIIDPPLTRLDRWRLGLGVTGLGFLAAGAVWAVQSIPPAHYPSVVVWGLGAIVLHDAVLAPLLALVALAAGRASRWMGPALAAVARTAFVIAACCALVAIPGVIVRAIGPRNDTIHSVDYVVVLAVLWCAAVLTGLAALSIAVVRARRRRARTM